MSRKQRAAVRSSSLGDVCLFKFNNVQPIKTPAAVSKRKQENWERPRRSILTLGSPPRDSNQDEDDIGKGFGKFLEACFYCRKELGPCKDVFMGGYVHISYYAYAVFMIFLSSCLRVFQETTSFFFNYYDYYYYYVIFNFG